MNIYARTVLDNGDIKLESMELILQNYTRHTSIDGTEMLNKHHVIDNVAQLRDYDFTDAKVKKLL